MTLLSSPSSTINVSSLHVVGDIVQSSSFLLTNGHIFFGGDRTFPVETENRSPTGRKTSQLMISDTGRGGTSCIGHQGGQMSLQISMQGGENRSLPSHISMASLPVVRLKFGEN